VERTTGFLCIFPTIEAGIENKSVYLFKDKRIINSSCFFFSLGILSGPV